ncbi:MAG TPA: serine protease [Acetobacteraceae bacterium]|nr:serine protease [Acetobacteraceae bacterium]
MFGHVAQSRTGKAARAALASAFGAVLFALSAGAPAVQAQPAREFRVVNGTQTPITELRYRTPDATQFPAQSALVGAAIAPGQQRRFGLDPNMPCVWDIRVSFGSGQPSIFVDVDLCRSPELRVTEIGITEVIVRNRTNQDIRSLATRVPARADFGNNILQGPIRAGQSGVISVAYATLGCHRDLRVGFEGGAQQTRRRAELCSVREFDFDTVNRNEYVIENTAPQPITGLFTRIPGGPWAEIRGLEPVPSGNFTLLFGDISQTCMREVRVVLANRQELVSGPVDICAADRISVGAQAAAAVPPQPGAAPAPAPGPAPGPAPQPDPGPTPGPMVQVPGPPAGPRVVTLANAWHIPLREVYFRLPGSRELGPNLLGRGSLEARREMNVPLPQQGCRFDVLGLYGDEYGFTAEAGQLNLDLCQQRRVVLNGPPAGERLGTGSGFYATRTGLIVTNRHVTRMCNSVRMQVGSLTVPLEMVVDDPVNDLAILRGPSRATPAVVFRADGQPARLGETVMAIGYPIGSAVGNQVFPVSGTISAVAGRRGQDNEFSMTAPINPGHSGGPIFDESGLLVGVAVAGITRIGDRNIQNVNFGIRAAVLRRLLRSINAEVEEAPPGQPIRAPDLIDRSLPLVLNLSCFS